MEFTVNDHLINKEPIVSKIYEKLIAVCEKFGTVNQSAKKSSIHLDAKSGFAGVYTRKNYILLKIHTNFKIDNERVEKCEKISANRYKHTIKLESEKDVDKQLTNWLKSAYELKK
ncbi:MAG: hypothetical protein KDC86_14700 [Saprospiraceae bacterium]|nr:hypothetical protein [Saprospiraceae bacterium]